MKRRFVALCFVLAALIGCAGAPARSDRFVELRALEAQLLSHDSATLTLERWCADHHLADPPRIVARRMRNATRSLPGELRARLSVDTKEPIAYRHVQLICGEHVLSEADNWYVPGRLTEEMNHLLDTTDEPFGKVVKPLGFQRRTLTTELLWRPQTLERTLPRDLLRHTAVLYSAEQVPFSAVVETYQSGLFESADAR